MERVAGPLECPKHGVIAEHDDFPGACSQCGRGMDRWVRVPVSRYERLALLAGWIERDRRESDKVLAYAQEIARITTTNDV